MKDIVTNIGTKENNDAKEIIENTIDIFYKIFSFNF